jgi:hypothetical protein
MLVLPNNPADAFRAPGFKVRYAAPPRQLGEIHLGLQQRQCEVTLALDPEPGKPRPPTAIIHYSNMTISNHASGDPLEGDLHPVEMNLCAQY